MPFFPLSSLELDKPSLKPPGNPVKSHEQQPKETVHRGLPANLLAKASEEQDLEIEDAFAKMETIPDVAKERIEQILDTTPRTNKVEFACDFLLAWQAIANETTHQTSKNQEKYWRHWCSYVASCKADPYLETVEKLTGIIIATAFASRVRTGVYRQGKELKVHGVTDALMAISTTCELVGKQSPLLKEEATYLLPIKRCIKGLRRQDTPPVPQLDVPIDVPVQVYRAAHVLQSTTPAKQAMGDLALISFYYLLCSGEYTKP